MPHHSRRKKKRSHYSKGELNRLIDSLLHPLFDRSPTFVIADTILHGLVEQNPPETAIKIIRYSLHKIIEEIARALKQHQVAHHTYTFTSKS